MYISYCSPWLLIICIGIAQSLVKIHIRSFYTGIIIIMEHPEICNSHKVSSVKSATPAQNQTFPDWTSPVWILVLGQLFLFFFFSSFLKSSFCPGKFGDSIGIWRGFFIQCRPHIQIWESIHQHFLTSSLCLGQRHPVWCYHSGIGLSCVLFLQRYITVCNVTQI